jgi:large subunit ribosomal protein L29
MAMKKAHDLRDLPLEDLESLEREKAEELMNLRLRLRLRQVDNPLSIRTARRELATIKTVITEKKKQAATS